MTGRNELCPCGSGKKFKHCHGGIDAAPSDIAKQFDIQQAMQQKLKEMQAQQVLKEQQQGLGRPIISFVSNGYRMVAVGDTLHWSTSWKTFHDFLLYYIKKAVGEDWGNAELKKPYEERHPILQWYHQLCLYQQQTIKEPGKVSEAPMIGAVEAYLQLAYYLYLLAHNEELQKRLLTRLRSPTEFPGAYYECYVFASLIKAGFDLEFEDETDGASSHCECVATHRVTGKKFSVEAKAIRRAGAMGATENATQKAFQESIRDQLYKALSKVAAHPRIIFVDANLPSVDGERIPAWIDDAVGAVRKAETDLTINRQPAPPAYVMVTNHPHHYHSQQAGQRSSAVALGFKISDFGHGIMFPSLRSRYFAKQKHAGVEDLMDSLQSHYEIPSTFEPEIPLFYFGDGSTPRLKIGSRYLVPDATGKEVEGILETATVIENEKVAYGIYILQEGYRISVTTPLTDDELVAFKKYPDTFFGVVQSQGKRIDDPYEQFEWMMDAQKHMTREKLLDMFRLRPDFSALQTLTREELMAMYCEDIVAQLQAKKSGKI